MIYEGLNLTDDHDAEVMAPEMFWGVTTARTMDSLMSLIPNLDVMTSRLSMMLTQVWPSYQLTLVIHFSVVF